jgi:hypothetical protein
MKKNKVLVMSLIITLLCVTGILLYQKQQEQRANEIFLSSLREVGGCFAVDYTKIHDEDKISYYMNAAGNLHTALYILPFTSYSKNEDLSGALYGLYMSITLHTTPKSTNRWRAFNEKEIEILKALHYIEEDPMNKNNSKTLTEIAKDISY